jgi:hypothetical protein
MRLKRVYCGRWEKPTQFLGCLPDIGSHVENALDTYAPVFAQAHDIMVYIDPKWRVGEPGYPQATFLGERFDGLTEEPHRLLQIGYAEQGVI